MKSWILILCALASVRCASNFDETKNLLESAFEKLRKFDGFVPSNDQAISDKLKSFRNQIKGDLINLEQGLLSGNEGRMSGLILKLKSSIELFEMEFRADESGKGLDQTVTEMSQIFEEIQTKLKGDPGWTPSWHYISQFLESFLQTDF